MALKIDLGCGASKKPGYIGVDSVAVDGVDHVINIQHDPLPFKDKSVDEIYSSHCFEHIDNFILTFREISRISREGALLEFWTPHAWSNEGFMYDHVSHFTALHYLHPTKVFPEVWKREMLGAYWHLEEIRYMIDRQALNSLARGLVRLDFALKHMNNISWEFCARMRVSHVSPPEQDTQPKITFTMHHRDSRVYPVKAWNYLGVLARLERDDLRGRVSRFLRRSGKN